MRRWFYRLAFFVLSSMLITGVTASAAAKATASVMVDGTILPISGVVINGSTLVPLRGVVQKLGGTVTWQGISRPIVIASNGTKIDLTVGSHTAVVNGQSRHTRGVAKLIGNHTYIPLRFIAQNLGASVDWKSATRTVVITLSSSNQTSTSSNSNSNSNAGSQTSSNSSSSSPSSSSSSSASATTKTVNKYMSYNAADKTVNLNLIGAEGSANDGFNFDGDAKGALTITVPKGWKVNVNFTNEGALPHSATVLAPNASTMPPLTLAFTGAAVPNPVSGIAPNGSASFSFTASKTGKYKLVCAVPGHEALGMWDWFTVTSSGMPSYSG